MKEPIEMPTEEGTSTGVVEPCNNNADNSENVNDSTGDEDERHIDVEHIVELEDRQDEDELILNEILTGRTHDDLIADKQLNKDIAQMADILQDTQPLQSAAPVRKSRQWL